ncbi:MAG: iron-sulfur cluster repair di-iron protein [Bacteroidota bacterium]|jgi:regulator of cell morphogenesis and NO signaling
MLINNISTQTIKEIVTENFQTAAVFEKYSLDFCCRGGKTINEACTEKNVSVETVLNDLADLGISQDNSGTQYAGWSLDVLIDYIVKNHHAYVTRMIPVLYTHTQKIAAVHGSRHPEVIEIAKHFETVAVDLQQHMQKEEQMLFPFILTLLEAKKTGLLSMLPPFGSVKNPIKMMEREHQAAGDEMYGIRSLSSGYLPPDDACTTYRVAYQELQEFEKDLHQHVHLENNILFPKASALEQELLSKN